MLCSAVDERVEGGMEKPLKRCFSGEALGDF
jgi:hypothetical protein